MGNRKYFAYHHYWNPVGNISLCIFGYAPNESQSTTDINVCGIFAMTPHWSSSNSTESAINVGTHAYYHAWSNYADNVRENFISQWWWGTGGNNHGNLDSGIWHAHGGPLGGGIFLNECANGSGLHLVSTHD